MSEYNNFLSYFDKEKKKKEEEENLRQKTEAALGETETEPDGIFSVAPQSKTDGGAQESPRPEKKAEGPVDIHFIKKNDVPFLKADVGGGKSPTAVGKFTDRFEPFTPEREKPSERTESGGRGYAESHSASKTEIKFIFSDDEEEEKVPAQPEASSHSANAGLFEASSADDATPTRVIGLKGERLAEIALSAASPEEGEQLAMEGFGQLPTDGNERKLEMEVEKGKEKKLKSFRSHSKSRARTSSSPDRVFSSDSDSRRVSGFAAGLAEKYAHLNSGFVPISSEEYRDPAHRRKVFSRLIGDRKSVIIRLLLLSLVGAAALLVNTSAAISAAMNNGFFSVFGGRPEVYAAVNLVFLLFAAVLTADDLKKGVFSIIKARPRTDSLLLFMFVCSFIQCGFTFFTQDRPESDFHLMTGAVILLCIPLLLSKVFFCNSTRHCFKSAAASSDKACLRRVSDSDFAAEALMDPLAGEKVIVYAGKTRFISSFIERGRGSASAAELSSRSAAVCAISSAAAGVAGYIASGSAGFAISCLTLCACLSLPVGGLVFLSLALSKENETLSVKGACIQSYSDSRALSTVDDIMLEDSELFTAEVVSVLPASGINAKQAVFCALALTSRSEGALKDAFSVADGTFEEDIPAAEDFLYENKLGFSAYVRDCRVLLGTADFLASHSIDAPDPEALRPADSRDCRPLFLAIEGHFAAVFFVKYTCRGTVGSSLAGLAKNGTNILLAASDPSITESFAETLLGLPRDCVLILGKTAGEKYLSCKNTVTDSEDAGIIFQSSADGLLRVIDSAEKLNSLKKITGSVSGMCLGVCLAMSFVLSLTGSVSGTGIWLPLLLQALCIFFCLLLPPVLAANDEVKNFAENIRRFLYAKKRGTREKRAVVAGEKPEPHGQTEKNGENNGCSPEKAAEDAEKSPIPAAKVREIPKTDTDDKETRAAEADTLGSNGSDPGQLFIMPDGIDFGAITGDEPTGEPTEITVTEEMLEEFAAEALRDSEKRNAPRKKDKALSRRFSSKKHGENTAAQPKKRSILSYADDSLPPPPRFDLSKKPEDEENDPLKARFVPPESTGPTELYNDDFFFEYNPRGEEESPTDDDDGRELIFEDLLPD